MMHKMHDYMTHMGYMKDRRDGDMTPGGPHGSRWVLEVMTKGLVGQVSSNVATLTREGSNMSLTWSACQR